MTLDWLGPLAIVPTAFAALMPVVNPFGTALIILGMVGSQPEAVYRQLAAKVTVLMLVYVAVVILIGQWLLHFFGISLPVMQVGGGLTLAAMGWRTLAGGQSAAGGSGNGAAADARSILDNAFYPYTFPLTVGPGTMVVLLTLSAHATRGHALTTLLSHAGIFVGAMLQAALVYVCYRYAPKLAQRLSPSAVNAIQQLMAFILLCIGGQIAWGGISSLAHELAHPAAATASLLWGSGAGRHG